MPKKYLISFLFLTLFLFNGRHCLLNAEPAALILSKQDLTWVSCAPNDDIETVVDTLKQNYKVEMNSMAVAGVNSYVGGDPTPAMAWVLSIDFSDHGKVTGMKYGRFKKSNGGIKIKTSRGIEAGASMSRVHERYGHSPTITRKRDPAMKYVYLEYPFVLEETGQKGKLIFTLQHKVKVPELEARVIVFEWVID
jgi:hypothetical protein